MIDDWNIPNWVLQSRRFKGKLRENGLWQSNVLPGDSVLIVTDGLQEALAHYAIFEPVGACYASGGLRLAHLLSTWQGAVYAAVRANREGQRLAEWVQAQRREPITVVKPGSHESWSEWIQSRRGFPWEISTAVPTNG